MQFKGACCIDHVTYACFYSSRILPSFPPSLLRSLSLSPSLSLSSLSPSLSLFSLSLFSLSLLSLSLLSLYLSLSPLSLYLSLSLSPLSLSFSPSLPSRFLVLFYCALFFELKGFQSYFLTTFGPRFGLVFGLVRNLWFKTHLGAQFKCIYNSVVGWGRISCGFWYNLMLCLKKNTIWPQKFVAEIGKVFHVFGCFGKSKWKCLPKTYIYIYIYRYDSISQLWTLRLGAFQNKDISYQIIHESCVHMVF